MPYYPYPLIKFTNGPIVVFYFLIFHKCQNLIITITMQKMEDKVVWNKKGIWNQIDQGSNFCSFLY